MLINEEYAISNLIRSTNSNVLNQIHNTDVNIAIWNREFKISYLLYKKINEGLSFEFKQSGRISYLTDELKDFFAKKLAWQKELFEDVKRILKLYKQITEVDTFKILFATVNTDMCKKFHTDINDLRLLCTYSGPGTLFQLKKNNIENLLSANGDNRKIVKVQNKIDQVPTGDIAIIKGALYPKSSTNACMHRSPSIEETDQTRLVLRIDTNNLFDELNF
jgi:hypothetical protein